MLKEKNFGKSSIRVGKKPQQRRWISIKTNKHRNKRGAKGWNMMKRRGQSSKEVMGK